MLLIFAKAKVWINVAMDLPIGVETTLTVPLAVNTQVSALTEGKSRKKGNHRKYIA
jgi:hypothetical protein